MVINEKSSLFDFILIMMRKMQLTLDTQDKQPEIKNTVHCIVEHMLSRYDKWIDILSDETMRRHIIEMGYKQAEDFLTTPPV